MIGKDARLLPVAQRRWLLFLLVCRGEGQTRAPLHGLLKFLGEHPRIFVSPRSTTAHALRLQHQVGAIDSERDKAAKK